MNAVYLGDKPTKTTAVVNADEIPLLDSQDLSSGRKKVKKVTAANLKSSILAEQPLVYVAKVEFSDGEPIIQEFKNTLGVSVEWFYDSPGTYYGTFSNTISPNASVYVSPSFIHNVFISAACSTDDIVIRANDSSLQPSGSTVVAFIKVELYP